jgi:transposase-like protein
LAPERGVLLRCELSEQTGAEPMNILARGRAFLQSLQDLTNRTVWEWRRCPQCGETDTQKYGFYKRHPWFIEGRRQVAVQRHRCNRCRATYSERSALLVRGGWYAREVRRLCVDHWQHGGSSLRRTAEFVRSLLGRQERWLLWRPLDRQPTRAQECHLSAATVERWLAGAGREAERSIEGQLEGIAS